jgi:hypothetical protein
MNRLRAILPALEPRVRGSARRNRSPQSHREAAPATVCGTTAQPGPPEGRQIAFERAIGPTQASGPPAVAGIFVMNADGSNVRQLTQLEPNSGSEDHGPTWSPDGRRIAFMRSNNTIDPLDASSIYTIESDGSDLRLARRMPRRWPGAGWPDWSPDGSRILLRIAHPGGPRARSRGLQGCLRGRIRAQST